MNKDFLILFLVIIITGCDSNEKKKTSISTVENNALIKSNNTNEGIYYCVKCNQPLYKSENNYNSDDKNESFDLSMNNKVEFKLDYKTKNNKTILKCKKCGTKLGNVWNDGPKETTGNRHCVSKNALIFKSLNK
jgi:peptide-methionine (R)-S-oxide reductase